MVPYYLSDKIALTVTRHFVTIKMGHEFAHVSLIIVESLWFFNH